MRIRLVRLAMAGDVRAIDALRLLTLHAGVFATLSVHNTVLNQERQYARWLAGHPIVGLSYHVNAARSVGAWIAADFDIALYADTSGETLVSSLISISGLGPAKSTFMGALMGYDACPCIDVHMSRMFGLPRAYANLAKYRAAVAASPLRHTLQQWEAFMIVPLFARDQHDCYFRQALPLLARAIAPTP
jgi:hypothetical protein